MVQGIKNDFVLGLVGVVLCCKFQKLVSLVLVVVVSAGLCAQNEFCP